MSLFQRKHQPKNTYQEDARRHQFDKKTGMHPGDAVLNYEKPKPSLHRFFHDTHEACEEIGGFFKAAVKSACRTF